MIFGISIFSYSGVNDEDLLRTANVLAQWFDNDEDGTANHKRILTELDNTDAYVFIVENQGQVDTHLRNSNVDKIKRN